MPRPCRSGSFAALAIVALAASPHAALAQDDGGASDGGGPAPAPMPCVDDALGCHTTDADWFHRDGFFSGVMFDTGWVPSGSPVQIRTLVAVGGATEIALGGTIGTSWPEGLSVSVPGRPGTGRITMDYGLELSVRMRFDVTVAGIRYRWEGDVPVPLLPAEDLRTFGEAMFDPFVMPPSMPRPVRVMDSTDRFSVFEYDAIGGFIPVPGVGGGFTMDLEWHLAASYRGDRIAVSGPAGAASAIEIENAFTVLDPASMLEGFGASSDVVVHPEGTLVYDGSIILYPTLFLEIAGSRTDVPIAMIPIDILSLSSAIVFDDVTSHVPLPDLSATPALLDFGDVAIGARDEQTITIANAGEAPLNVVIEAPPPPFAGETTSRVVPPRSSVRHPIAFAPTAPGAAAGVVTIRSDDPDSPVITVRLQGRGSGEFPLIDAGPGTGDAGIGGAGGPPTDGGCGCVAPGAARLQQTGASAAGWAMIALAAAAVARRRRPR